MKLFLNIIFLILIIFVISKNDYKEPETDPGYEELLKWGKDNHLNITNKIRFLKDKNRKYYIAKNLIPEEDKIMDIPPECMMNINKSLDLLNSKKFRKAYNDYVENDKQNTDIVLKDEHHADQAFLAFILYIVNHKMKSFEKKKNKFLEYYKPMFYMFTDNLDNLPFYFSSEQMKFFLNTSFGSVFEILNRYINDEATVFEKKIYKKTISYEEYLVYRIFTIQKSYEVEGQINLVPFLDYFKKNFKSINCELKIEGGHIIIKAKQNIFPGEDLIMPPIAISNQHRFIFFGETFDELLDKFESYSIPTIIPNFVTDKRVEFDVNTLGHKSRVDLGEIDFYKGMINTYKKFAKIIQEDDSEEGACKLILKYITRIKQNFDYIKEEDIRNAFFDKRDSDNVKRIIDGEKKFLERRIGILNIYIENLKEREYVKPNYDAEDVNDL